MNRHLSRVCLDKLLGNYNSFDFRIHSSILFGSFLLTGPQTKALSNQPSDCTKSHG